MDFLSAILLGALVISSVTAAIWRVAALALLLYLHEKEYTPPSEEEMRACCAEAWKRVLKRR